MKSDIEIFVWSVDKTTIYISPVGVDVLDDPRKIKIKAKISIEYFFLIVGTGVLDCPKTKDQYIFLSVIFILITDGYAICNQYDLGQSRTPVPTNDIEIVAFGYRPNKDFYVALHNKKETRGGLSVRVFLHRY